MSPCSFEPQFCINAFEVFGLGYACSHLLLQASHMDVCEFVAISSSLQLPRP